MAKTYMSMTVRANERPVTVIKIRRGINGFRYSVCDEDGFFINNMEKLSSARKRWEKEIRWGQVRLVRELDKQPDMSRNEAIIRTLNSILTEYGRKQNRRRTGS